MWRVLGDGVKIELSSAADAAVQLADEALNAEARYRAQGTRSRNDSLSEERSDYGAQEGF